MTHLPTLVSSRQILIQEGNAMEARRSFEGGAKSSKVWIVIAGLLAAMALGLAGGYAAKSPATVIVPGVTHAAVQGAFQAPDAKTRNDAILSQNSKQYVTHKKLTVF
jgi:hypothetical protein